MNNTKLRRTDYFFLFIVLIGFYLLYRFSIFTSDDYYYSFIGGMSGGINDEYIPVNSLTDAIKSNIHDYMNWNGRFIIHTLTSYFCGVIGVDIFRILNSIVFILLVAGLIKLIRGEFGYNKTDKFIILFLLFILMPEPGFIFLGHIAMVVNYLWTACAIVYFIILYNKIKDAKNYNSGINIILLLIGLIIGSLQESFTIGVSGALFFHYCFNFKKFKGSVAWLVIGFWIGTCMVTLAPGNFVRLSREVEANRFSGLIKYASQFAHLIFDSKLLLITLIVSVIYYFKNKSSFIAFLRKNYFYYLSILFNGLIVTIVYTGKRQLTCIELFSMILIIKMFYSYYLKFIENKATIINIVISAILVLLYFPIYKDREINYLRYENLHNKEPNNGVIVDKDFIERARYIKEREITYNYNIYGVDDFNNFYIHGLSLMKSNGIDINFFTAILPISPTEIESKFSDNNIKYINDNENLAYYFRCPKDITISKIYYLAEPATILGKIRNKLFNKVLNRKDITTIINKFQTEDYNYYVFYDEGCKIHDFEIEYKESAV